MFKQSHQYDMLMHIRKISRVIGVSVIHLSRVRMNKLIAQCAIALILVVANSNAQDNGANDRAKAATDLARATLAKELKIAPRAIDVVSITPQTWANGSLGCPKPGMFYTQMVSSGYALILNTARGNYRVHATSYSAVICGAPTP